MNHFGEHLTIDGYDGNHDLLNDKKIVMSCLADLPTAMGMHILGKPVIYSAPGSGKKDPGGWSGFVVIQESHIAVHTFPARGFVSADVYTCQNGLKTEKIVRYFKKTFKLKGIETNFLKRGLKYPAKNIY